MLFNGMMERGHNVELWMPRPKFYKFKLPWGIRKWMGYLDQFVVFPVEIKPRIKACPLDTLFVFIDHALGLWIPMVADRPHVIHCHDFLAQRSALGEIPENHVRWTGRQYQSLIRRGYSQGKNFISVSHKTMEDLQHFLTLSPNTSEMVYNGLNQIFTPNDPTVVRDLISKRAGINLTYGYLLHVGGNDWYKNRSGVIEIYNNWRLISGLNFPLLMIGKAPERILENVYNSSPFKSDIHLLSNIEDDFLRLAYAGASVFLYPSIAEGFGWPIAEAMASGCPVVTTNEAPMSEVGGNAAFYISRKPFDEKCSADWAAKGAKVVNQVLTLPPSERKVVVEAGVLNSKRFASEPALDKIEAIYKNILSKYGYANPLEKV